MSVYMTSNQMFSNIILLSDTQRSIYGNSVSIISAASGGETVSSGIICGRRAASFGAMNTPLPLCCSAHMGNRKFRTSFFFAWREVFYLKQLSFSPNPLRCFL